MKTEPNHIRVIDRRGGRRINDRIGQTHNLCHAPPTAWDVMYRDARAMTSVERSEWIDCPKCLSLLPTTLCTASQVASHTAGESKE